MPNEPVPYTDIGGGGPNPPHGEDFFNRIVNVHWPKKRKRAVGGLYMCGDYFGYVNTSPVIKPDEPYDSQWRITRTPPPLGPGQTGQTSNIYAMAYGGQPPESSVFVYAALTYVNGVNDGETGIDISYSSDGSNWSAATHPWIIDKENDILEIIGITYDKSFKIFNVAIWHGDYTGATQAQFEEIIFGTSLDGTSFNETSRQRVWVYGQVPDGYPGSLNMPAADFDQVVVSDSTGTTLQNSGPPVYHWRFKEFVGGTISRTPGPGAILNPGYVYPPGYTSIPTVTVHSIAWSGGVWVVGGQGGVNVSYDDGLSWTDAGVDPGATFVSCVAAGAVPISV